MSSASRSVVARRRPLPLRGRGAVGARSVPRCRRCRPRRRRGRAGRGAAPPAMRAAARRGRRAASRAGVGPRSAKSVSIAPNGTWTTGTSRKSDCQAAAMAAADASAASGDPPRRVRCGRVDRGPRRLRCTRRGCSIFRPVGPVSVSGSVGGPAPGRRRAGPSARPGCREDVGLRGDQRLVQIEGGQEDLGPGSRRTPRRPTGREVSRHSISAASSVSACDGPSGTWSPHSCRPRATASASGPISAVEPGDLGRFVVDGGPGAARAASASQLLRRGTPAAASAVGAGGAQLASRDGPARASSCPGAARPPPRSTARCANCAAPSCRPR